MTSGPISEIEAELAKLPPAVLEAYHQANDTVKESFGEEEIGLWARASGLLHCAASSVACRGAA